MKFQSGLFIYVKDRDFIEQIPRYAWNDVINSASPVLSYKIPE